MYGHTNCSHPNLWGAQLQSLALFSVQLSLNIDIRCTETFPLFLAKNVFSRTNVQAIDHLVSVQFIQNFNHNNWKFCAKTSAKQNNAFLRLFWIMIIWVLIDGCVHLPCFHNQNRRLYFPFCLWISELTYRVNWG